MRRALGIALFSIAILQLGFRGMQRLRSDVPLWDFVSVYSAARTWIQGGDPYDLSSVVATWHKSGIFSNRDVSYFATVYPPSSLAILVPLAFLPAPIALSLWLLFTIMLLVMQFAALASTAGLKWRDPRLLILVGGALAAAPLQFGILSGQLSLPAISMCIIAFCLSGSGRDRLAGILLGLACAIKPQIAAPFVVYYLIVRRLNVAVFAIVIGGAIGAISVGAMHFSHVNWIAGWTQSVAATTRIGGVNDYGWGGEFRDEIVDLKMLLVSFIHNPLALRILVLGIVAMLLAWYVQLFPRAAQRTYRTELLAVAGLSALVLLPVYHRVYDVTLLTTALAWALAELDGPRRKYALAMLIPMLVFLIPFDIVRTVGRRINGLSEASQTGWWQSFIAPHYALGLLALTIAILVTMSSGTPSQTTD